MRHKLAGLLSTLGIVAGVLAFCADVPVNPWNFSTTASAGTLGPYNCIGASRAVWTFTSGGGATLTIKGSADKVIGGSYTTNTNFGSSGVITTPTAAATANGDTSNYPQGIEATFTGNTGTLSGSVTCTGAQSNTIGGTVSAVVSFPPSQNVAVVAPTDAAGNVKAQPQSTVAVQPPTPFGPTPCPAASVSASVCSSPAPYATAVSPAPGNVLAHGYSSNGATAPIICEHTGSVQIAATTQATETLLVASAAGKKIVFCSIAMSGGGTATGFFGVQSATTNVCGAGILPVFVANAGGTTNGVSVTQGSGVGIIAATPVGTAACYFNASAGAAGTSQINFTYEQLLHALTPEQLSVLCSIPKRCSLYGLAKLLNAKLGKVEPW